MTSGLQQIRYDGIHCNLQIERRSDRVILLKIKGTDVGEFGDAPMKALDDWIAGLDRFDLFINAYDVRGASIEVSGEWAAWLTARKARLRTITMLTGSRFIQITAEFVRRFASLEGRMRICTEPGVFDQALRHALL